MDVIIESIYFHAAGSGKNIVYSICIQHPYSVLRSNGSIRPCNVQNHFMFKIHVC